MNCGRVAGKLSVRGRVDLAFHNLAISLVGIGRAS